MNDILSDAVSAHAATQVTMAISEWETVTVPPDLLLKDGCLEVYPEVVSKEYFTIRQHPGGLKLQAGGFIGLIPLNDRLTIEVSPRVPLDNLSRLMHIGEGSPRELARVGRLYGLDSDMYESLIDVYARALVGYIDGILAEGLIKIYEPREAATSFPRGRIEIGKTVTTQLAKGVSHRVVASWFERTADTPANRCLKYATWLLAQYRLVGTRSKESRKTVRLLNRAFQSLAGIELDRSCRFLTDPLVLGRQPLPRLRRYYRAPLDLALTIIRHQAPTVLHTNEGMFLPSSLIMDMSTLFEAYVRRVLQLKAAEDQWTCQVLDGNKGAPKGGAKRLFDTGLTNLATPDIVLKANSASATPYPLLLEVKYKPAGESPSRDDLNQTIAYASSYSCDKIVVIQPQAHVGQPPAGLRTLGTIAGTTVYQYVFNLAAQILEEEESVFAAAVNSML